MRRVRERCYALAHEDPHRQSGRGKVEVAGDVPEGQAVAVLAPDAGGFRPTIDEEDELARALEDIRSGDYVDARQLISELKGERTD